MNTPPPLPRLLMVDDEPNVIEGIARRLRRDYQLFSANDGAQALRLLEAEGEMHIILTDMRMPIMDGAQLLVETRKSYPDMIRILLTGHADMNSAIAAVNEGQIFRFLTKPCPSDTVRAALRDAMRQHELIDAERTVLEKTLRGALEALSEVLALAMPEAFGTATRIRNHASTIAKAAGIEEVWRIEAAATLSQLGAITLEPSVATKLYHGERLAPEEQKRVERLPIFATELLSSIPRLEPVCDLIAYGFASGVSGRVPPSTEAQVLRLCAAFDTLSTATRSSVEALAKLQQQTQGYDPQVLKVFFELTARDSSGAKLIEVNLYELRDGMVLADDVYSSAGTLLLARGQCVRANVIARLQSMKSALGAKQTVRVRLGGD